MKIRKMNNVLFVYFAYSTEKIVKLVCHDLFSYVFKVRIFTKTVYYKWISDVFQGKHYTYYIQQYTVNVFVDQ